MPEIVLVIGGARSGKSRFAQNLALDLGKDRVTYLATALPIDEEMTERIARHKLDRPRNWKTIEISDDLVSVVKEIKTKVVLLDCLSLYISKLQEKGLSEEEILENLNLFANQSRSYKLTVIIVSNEVGGGIVPDNFSARKYRDLLGLANQQVASQASNVYLLVAGVPLKIKGTDC